MEIGLKPTFLLFNKLFVSRIHRLPLSEDGKMQHRLYFSLAPFYQVKERC